MAITKLKRRINLDILVLGDAHASPETGELERFERLGDYIADTRPDALVIIGDFISLDSLSAWDSDKRRKMENRRYAHDITVGNHALDVLLAPYHRAREEARRNRKRMWEMELIFCEGNHEERLERYIDLNPVIEDHVNVIHDLHLEDRGFNVIRYGQYVEIGEILFTHIPFAGNGKPFSSTALTTSMAKRVLQTMNKSVVYGHTHKLEVATLTRRNSEMLYAINVGCYTADMPEPYAVNSVDESWRGVVHLVTNQDGKLTSMQFITKEVVYDGRF